MNTLNIKKFLFRPVGPASEMVLRPFTADIREDSAYSEPEQFFTLTSDSCSPAYIDECGFKQPRLSFLLEVIANTDEGLTHALYQGYTSPVVIETSRLDSEMRLYFNNVQRFDPYSARLQPSVVLQILRGLPPLAFNTPRPLHENLFHLRPCDAARSIALSSYLDMANVSYAESLSAVTLCLSHQSNTLPKAYIETLLRPILEETTSELPDTFVDCLCAVEREPQCSELTLFRELSAKSNTFMEYGYITYGEFCQLFSDLDGAAQIVDEPVQPVNGDGEADLQSSSIESVWSMALFQRIPGIMRALCLYRVSLSILKTYGDSKPRISISGTPFEHVLIKTIETAVLPPFARDPAMCYHILVDIDLMREGYSVISVNDGPVHRFRAPIFCDSQYSPVIQTEYNQTQTVIYELGYLARLTAEKSWHL